MTKLAETYIHLKIEASKKFKIESEEYLYSLSRSTSSEIFEQDAEIYIRFENGSWKTWVVVAGAIYIGIGQYGSFRSGIDYMVTDARKFSNTIIEHFIDKNKLNQEIIFRTERRLGVPGKIQRLYQRIEALQKFDSLSGAGPPWEQVHHRFESYRQKELLKIKSELIKILELLDNEDDQTLFLKSLNTEVSHQPLEPPKIKIKQLPEIKMDLDQPKIFNQIPLSKKQSLPYEDTIFYRNEVAIKEEDEIEKLKNLIISKKFDIDIG